MAYYTPAIEPDKKMAVSLRDATFGGAAEDKAPTSGSDTISDREDAAAAAGSDGAVQPAEENTNGLPFSKARCIALVATVTGASFLNVSLTSSITDVSNTY